MESGISQWEGTKLGPLKTTFSLPPACLVYGGATVGGIPETVDGVPTEVPHVYFQGQGCGDGGILQDTSTCWPSATATGEPPMPLHGWGTYSPGVICPLGYTSACADPSAAAHSIDSGPSTSRNGSSILAPFVSNFAPQASETAIGCCPQGFTCDHFFGVQTCGRTFAQEVVTTGECGDRRGALSSLRTAELTPYFSIQTNVAGETLVTNSKTLLAPLFQLVFQPSDLALAQPTSIATSSLQMGLESSRQTTIATTMTTSAIGSAGHVPTASSSSSSQVSAGPGAGASRPPSTQKAIAVPIALALLALVLGVSILVWSCWRRRRRLRGRLPSSEPTPDLSATRAKSEVPGSEQGSDLSRIEMDVLVIAAELDGTARAELSRDGATHEAPGGEVAQELRASERN